ncbi:sulfotransferase domain-containing protein [Ekhidna sp.]|uniref:sulfotransferase domain-containing protein n=1 Tax=Ekhidna sp. TaxID=2608089 RepID=UPI003297A234
MPDRIVHIGYPKTGSTFLQLEVFPSIPGINYVDYRTCVKLFSDLIYLDDLDYDSGKAALNFAELNGVKPTLYSQEALSGPPFTFKGLNRSSIPVRLKDIGFNKIIVTIRNQIDIIDSLYRQYIYQGGVMKFADFIDLDRKWNHQLRAFNLDYLKFDSLIKCYQEEFGKSNVLILPLELLKEDQTLFLTKLCRFLNVDDLNVDLLGRSNESLSNLSTNILRIINHFTFNSQRPNQLITNRINTQIIKKIFQVALDPYFFGFFSNKKSYLKTHQVDVIKDYYVKSNFELDTLLEENLEDFGYPLS